MARFSKRRDQHKNFQEISKNFLHVTQQQFQDKEKLALRNLETCKDLERFFIVHKYFIVNCLINVVIKNKEVVFSNENFSLL